MTPSVGSTLATPASGLWVAAIDLGEVEGKRVRRVVRGQQKDTVLAKLRELQTTVDRGLPIPDHHFSTKEWLTWWLDEVLPGTVKDRTAENYRRRTWKSGGCGNTSQIIKSPTLQLGHGGSLRSVTKGEQLLEDFRRQRRQGDPRITPEGREILLRITKGDLAGDFAEALAEIGDVDPILSGRVDQGHDLD